jgi:hypothetical protein
MDREEYYTMTPAEIYENLKNKGYDWNQLLDTDTCWNYNEHESSRTQPFLSTRDVQNMHLGIYHPFWLPALEDKAKKAA